MCRDGRRPLCWDGRDLAGSKRFFYGTGWLGGACEWAGREEEGREVMLVRLAIRWWDVVIVVLGQVLGVYLGGYFGLW